MFLTIQVYGQDPIDVTDQTLKLGGLKEEVLYYGFAAGDKILFNFEEVDKKEIKEIEIVEYPNNSKFSDYKTSTVANKTITVSRQGVYIFRFKNSAISGRICKVKIQRIPTDNTTRDFNSTVTWEAKQETTYNSYTKDVVVGYDTIRTEKTKMVLAKSEQKEELLLDKSQRVHSISNENGNRTFVSFSLPLNRITPNMTQKVISWAYWVGVGDEANQAWRQNSQAIATLTKGTAKYFFSPLGALAIDAVSDLMIPKAGEDVSYYITTKENKDLFMAGYQFRLYDQGKGIAGYKKFIDANFSQGNYFVLLLNDNKIQGIDAIVKVVAIIETNTYENQPYVESTVTPRYEKKTFSEPVITTMRVPVTGIR